MKDQLRKKSHSIYFISNVYVFFYLILFEEMNKSFLIIREKWAKTYKHAQPNYGSTEAVTLIDINYKFK